MTSLQPSPKTTSAAPQATVVHNPLLLAAELLPVIYCFSGVTDGGAGEAYALAQDGTCLGVHYCSRPEYAGQDLGAFPGWRVDRHEKYRAHFPNGYRFEIVAPGGVRSHPGVTRARELNAAKAEAEEGKVGEG